MSNLPRLMDIDGGNSKMAAIKRANVNLDVINRKIVSKSS